MKTISLCKGILMSTFLWSSAVAAVPEKKDFCDFIPPDVKTVAVISPASFPNQQAIEDSMRRMQARGVKVKPGKYLFCPAGSRSKHASVKQRKEDFMNAWMDPEVDLIVCTRGGSGAQDLIRELDWDKMPLRPELKIIGFSNITCLTGALLRKGYGHPFAGPNLVRFAGLEPAALESFRRGMCGEKQKPFPLEPICRGDCRGGIYAGHLSLLAVLDAMPEYRVQPDGRIVFIECIGRTPEILTAEWNKLLASGFFRNVRGVVFGHFTKLGPEETVSQLLQKFADTLTCPVYKGFAYGHAGDIHTLDFFGQAEIRDNVLHVAPPAAGALSDRPAGPGKKKIFGSNFSASDPPGAGKRVKTGGTKGTFTMSYPSAGMRPDSASEAKTSLEEMLPKDFYARIREGNYLRNFYPSFADRKAWEAIAASPLKAQEKRILLDSAEEILSRPMEALSLWDYFRFAMDGDRLQYELRYFSRRIELGTLVLALCLSGDKSRYLPAVIDRLGAIMAEPTWCASAHVGDLRDGDPMPPPEAAEIVDLFNAETAQQVSLTLQLLGDEIKAVSPRFFEHCRTTTLKRVVYPVLKQTFWWMDTSRKLNNWTPWCCGNVLLAGAVLLDDPAVMEALLRRTLGCTSAFYDRIAADGYCDEGPGYWNKSFPKLFYLFRILDTMVPGAGERLFSDPKFRRMGDYEADMVVAGTASACCADCGHIPDTGIQTGITYDFGRRIGSAKLRSFALDRLAVDGKLPVLPGMQKNFRQGTGDLLSAVLDFFFCIPDDPAAEPRTALSPASFWPDRIGILRHPEGFSASLKANHNGENHNHNDLGHFTVYCGRRPLVIDLGTGIYSKKNFGAQRYELYYTSAIGHNALCFGDKMQQPGEQYRATLSMPDGRTLRSDLGKAYPADLNLQKYLRTLTCDAENVVVTDEFLPVDGAFMTLYSPSRVTRTSEAELDFGEGIICRISGGRCESVEDVPAEDVPNHWGALLKKIRITAESSPLRLEFTRRGK